MSLTGSDPHTVWETAKIIRLAAKYAACERAGDTRGMAKWENAADRITEQATKREERKEKERQAEAERNSREARKARAKADREEKLKKAKQLREARQHKAKMDRARGK